MKKRKKVKFRIQGEWVALACALMTATGIYLAMIHPSLASVAALDEARSERKTAMEDLHNIQREYQNLLTAITKQKEQLAALGGSPPSLDEKEAQLARIAALARNCRLKLDQYSPLGDVDTPEYSAVYVQFSGRGSFPQIREFFSQFESAMDYADVTHFTLTSSFADKTSIEPACMVTWSCKLSGMPRKPGPPSGGNQSTALPAVEVALNDP